MKLQFFGDSYDIVKRSLIAWLRSFGDWVVHPMFTESVSKEAAIEFSEFLGARLLSDSVLSPNMDRDQYFATCHSCGHLFLDPDTGLRMSATKGARASSYLFARELISMARARPSSLTLVFDQSVGRGSERCQIDQKLSHLSSSGLHGFAYVSHACFVLVGRDGALIDQAYETVLRVSRLPSSRLLKPSRRG